MRSRLGQRIVQRIVQRIGRGLVRAIRLSIDPWVGQTIDCSINIATAILDLIER